MKFAAAAERRRTLRMAILSGRLLCVLPAGGGRWQLRRDGVVFWDEDLLKSSPQRSRVYPDLPALLAAVEAGLLTFEIPLK